MKTLKRRCAPKRSVIPITMITRCRVRHHHQHNYFHMGLKSCRHIRLFENNNNNTATAATNQLNLNIIGLGNEKKNKRATPAQYLYVAYKNFFLSFDIIGTHWSMIFFILLFVVVVFNVHFMHQKRRWFVCCSRARYCCCVMQALYWRLFGNNCCEDLIDMKEWKLKFENSSCAIVSTETWI